MLAPVVVVAPVRALMATVAVVAPVRASVEFCAKEPLKTGEAPRGPTVLALARLEGLPYGRRRRNVRVGIEPWSSGAG